ncbi:MAG: SIMPL domain-containing protein [Cyclobacteriaceae bacterium]|nr:SIMPL domain-containing protein [Cyclobacteriaceae bacterium SS2]
MDKLGWFNAIIIFSGLTLGGYFISNTLVKGKAYDRSVTVKGLSEREVAADISVWPINITVAGNDLQNIQQEIESQKREVTKFFKDQGFNDEEFTIGPTNISDAKADLYNPGPYREFRYIVKSDFTIRTTNIDKLQKALSASLTLVSKGILISSKNDWRPIEYSFTGLNAIKPAMIEEATNNAREVAEKFAKDSNSQVGKIMRANQGLFTISDRDQNTPEIKTVRVVSTIEYQLKD